MHSRSEWGADIGGGAGAYPGMSRPGIPTSKRVRSPESRRVACRRSFSACEGRYSCGNAHRGGADKVQRARKVRVQPAGERERVERRRDERSGSDEPERDLRVRLRVRANGERKLARRAAVEALIQERERLLNVDRRERLVERLVEVVYVCVHSVNRA